MPSLRNLEAFASLFRVVGNEQEILAERGLAVEQPPLPDTEPVPLPETKKAERGADDEGAGITPDFAAFNDLLSGADDDLSPLSAEDAFPTEPDIPTGIPDLALDKAPEPALDASGLEENAELDDPLGGLDLTPPLPLDDIAIEEPALDTSIDTNIEEIPTLEDAQDVDGANPLGINPLEETGVEDSMTDSFDIPLPEETSIEDAFPETAFPETAAEPPAPEANLPLEDLEDAASVETSASKEAAASIIEEPSPLEEFAEPVFEDMAGSPVEEFEEAIEDEPAALADAADSVEELPDFDFAIPGIDTPAQAPPARRQEAPAGGGSRAKQVEINLSEEEYRYIEETLHSYPLNLRRACEEVIAGAAFPTAPLVQLVYHLVRGGSARDAAQLAGKILERTITIPRGFIKQTGAELEAEQSSFGYVFVKRFLPVFGFFLFIACTLAAAAYLTWQFIYKPIRADGLYKAGIERIAAGEYSRANERFNEAWSWYPKKKWFYTYAEAFRDARQYFYAEEKYDQLIAYTASRDRRGVPEKQGVLDYAAMEADYLRDYEKADRLIRNHILDWNPNDADGLIALGDVNLAFGDANTELAPEDAPNPDNGRYEIARQNYARYMEVHGRTDPAMERMLRYFIRADNLSEAMPLGDYFMSQKKLKCSPVTLSELGGYYIDKLLTQTRYVRDAAIEEISGEDLRNILLRAANEDPAKPMPHYHLARYYNMVGEKSRERQYLDNASALFDAVLQESAPLVRARIDTEQRLSHMLRDRREFFQAEERLVKAAGLYEDALSRRIFGSRRAFGSLYADLGDIAYFTKFSDDSMRGNWEEALMYYNRAVEAGYSTPEMQYRLGSAYYHLGDYRRAEERFFDVSMQTQANRRLLNALGNTSFLRGNYSAAEAQFSKLVTMLTNDRLRITDFRVNSVPAHRELSERLMIAQNNLGAVYDSLAARNSGSEGSRLRTRALVLYTESSRIWDNLSRDPATLVRPGLADFSVPTIGLPYLNTRNALYPTPGASPEIFTSIDRDMPEPSEWEELLLEM